MKKNSLFISFLSIALLFFACKNEPQTLDNPPPLVEGNEETKLSNTTPDTLPPIGKDEFLAIYNNVNSLDITFSNMPLSSSAEGNGARQYLKGVAPEQADLNAACSEFARMFLHKDGEEIADVGIYYSEKCAYYIFYENRTPKYANRMNKEGSVHIINMINMLQGNR